MYSSCSAHFKLTHSTFFKWNESGCIAYKYDAEALISVCQCVSKECDSLPVWPCGMPVLLKLEEDMNRPPTTNCLCTWSCVCVCVCRCYCWNIKVLPWWMYQRPQSLPAKPVAHIHWQIYIYTHSKAYQSVLMALQCSEHVDVIFIFYSTLSLHTLACRQLGLWLVLLLAWS